MLDVCKAHRGTFPGKLYFRVHIGPPSISPLQYHALSHHLPENGWYRVHPPTPALGSYGELAPGNATEQRLSI